MGTINRLAKAVLIVSAVAMLAACVGGGSPNMRYSVGVGYGGYYGHSPYGYYAPPVIIGPGPEIDRGPIAVPLPEPDVDFGMPDAGFVDMGGFDF